MEILKKFISYYKPHQRLFYLDMVCALIVSMVDLAFPQILNYFVKGVFLDSYEIILLQLPWIFIGVLLMYSIRSGCQYFITSWGHIMGARMESDMRQELFSHYQKLSFSYYDKNNTGEMMSKLTADLFDISELAHHGPENLFISLLKIVGSLALLFMINVNLTLIFLVIMLVMLGFSFVQNRRMRSIFTDNRKKIGYVNAQVKDSLAGIRVVKSFANEHLEKGKFQRSNLAFLDSKVDNYRVMGSYHAMNSFFQGLFYTAVLVCGGFFVANGSIAVHELAVYALYIGIFISPIEILINFTEQFQRGYAGFKRFCEVVQVLPEVTDKADAKELQNIKGAIVFDRVFFHYKNNHEVLNDVSLDIKPGQTIALVGPSGGGKTTLCSLLPRFYEAARGTITIDGKDVRSVTLKSLREAIGIVQQDVYLFAGTIRENILYGKPGASEEELIAAAKNAKIHDFIMSLDEGYEAYVGEHGVLLSGGQKQRLSIARVFLKNPQILILDEATSALDNESERYIQQSLEKLSQNRTTIVIAHRLSTIRHADEIVVIQKGSVRERGTHEALIAQNGIYSRYYRMQFHDLKGEFSDFLETGK